MAKGWENDCHLDQQRRVRKLARTKEVEDELEKELISEVADGNEVQSAMKLYEDIVSDWEATPTGKDTIAKVRIPDEQAFLGQHHATLQKDPDPRCKFSKRAVVGPMTGGSAGLPSVEKYMAKDGTLATPTAGERERERERESERSGREKRESSAAAAAAVAAMTGAAAGEGRATSPATASGSGGTTSPGAPKQSEVLHSFFQSLLKDKGGGGGAGSPKLDRLDRTTSSSAGRREPPTSNK